METFARISHVGCAGISPKPVSRKLKTLSQNLFPLGKPNHKSNVWNSLFESTTIRPEQDMKSRFWSVRRRNASERQPGSWVLRFGSCPVLGQRATVKCYPVLFLSFPFKKEWLIPKRLHQELAVLVVRAVVSLFFWTRICRNVELDPRPLTPWTENLFGCINFFFIWIGFSSSDAFMRFGGIRLWNGDTKTKDKIFRTVGDLSQKNWAFLIFFSISNKEEVALTHKARPA